MIYGIGTYCRTHLGSLYISAEAVLFQFFFSNYLLALFDFNFSGTYLSRENSGNAIIDQFSDALTFV